MTTVPVTLQERVPMPPALRRPAGPASSLTFGDVTRILRQRLFLILFTWFFITGAAIGGTWYWEKHWPGRKFTADTFVEVGSPEVKGPFDPFGRPAPVDLLNRYVVDQAQKVKQPRTLNVALQDSRITGTQWYREHQEDLLRQIESDLGVTPLPNTSYLRLTFTSRNKEEAARILDTIVEKYLDTVKLDSTSTFENELENYTKERDQLRALLAETLDRKLRFSTNQISVGGITQGLNVPGEQLRTMANEYTRMEAEVVQLKAMRDNYQTADLSSVMISPQWRMNIQQDPQVQALSNSLLGLQGNYLTLLTRVGKRNREVQNLEANIGVIQSQYDDLIRHKEQEIREFQAEAAEIAWLNMMKASNGLGERVATLEERQRDLDNKVAELKRMEDDEEALRRRLERSEDVVQQLRLAVGGRETVRVKQIGKANIPLKASSPRWELNVPVGSFLGLLMGVGLALLLELANTSIRTPRDIVRHVHTPILGTVPDLDDEEVNIERMELASHVAPRSMIAEAFRTIRTNLLLSAPAERQRTVLITSSKPEEGKTSVAVNLAISIGQSGRRVLLIDGNFHRPTLHTLFPHAKREGLSNILIGRGRLADLVSSTELPNLDVLTCGPIPPNPTELLTSRYMSELLNDAAERYDQVLVDGPPVLLVSDALVLASAVDGVILVCRAKTASRGAVQRAREQLERVNARVFGAVLNAAQVTRGGYFREQMRSYYDYQPEEALLAGSTKALPRNSETGDTQA